MSELRSAIDTLRAENLADMPDARIEEDFGELQTAAVLIDAEWLRRLAEIDRRGIYRQDGHLSTASWLTTRFKMAWGAARQKVRTARALEEMPETRRALENGDLPLSALRVLVEARDVEPSAFGANEAHLVRAARTHSVHVFRRIVAYWRQAAEREAALGGEERLRQQRSLHASVTFLGMVRVDGNLDPETGETLLSALQATLDAESRSGPEGDRRTAAQRRADALGEICRQWLDNADRPTVAGERPHVNLTVDAGAVGGREPSVGEPDVAGGAISELDHVGPIDPAVARRVVCDATIRRIVMAGR